MWKTLLPELDANDAKKLYREIGKEKVIVNETSATNDVFSI